jgi:putative flavoprotein involved in K+ transport
MIDTGLMDETVDTLPSPAARLACNPPVSGNDGGHDCNPRWLGWKGAILLGRLEGFRSQKALFAPDLEENLAKGDDFAAELRRRFDEHAVAAGLDSPDDEYRHAPHAVEIVTELDLRGAGIGSILWANGFRPDLDWINLPVLDEEGWPVQRRGITAFPGLYFVGLHWLHKRKSALFLGVGEDAEHVVTHITEG